MQKILVVEDEPDYVLGLRDSFEYEGYVVSVALDGEDGLSRALSERPDLIILDSMLPKLNGLDLCRQLRKQGIEIPIIMLTARGQEMDKVVGLEVGADDYVTKPFSIRELVARVHAHLRRHTRQVIDKYQFGGIELDFKSYQATKNGLPLEMTAREFDILRYFLEHRGETITRERLLDQIWGLENYPVSRAVDNQIAKLRQKIEEHPDEPKFIITVHRVGYKFLG